MNTLPIELIEIIFEKYLDFCVRLNRYYYSVVDSNKLKKILPVTKYEKRRWVKFYKYIDLVSNDHFEHHSINFGFRLMKLCKYTNTGSNLATMKTLSQFCEPSLIIQYEILLMRGLSNMEIKNILAKPYEYSYIWYNLYAMECECEFDESLLSEQLNILTKRLFK